MWVVLAVVGAMVFLVGLMAIHTFYFLVPISVIGLMLAAAISVDG